MEKKRTPMRGIAAKTLAATALAAFGANPAAAQSGAVPQPAEATLALRRFDVPAGPLGEALDAFARASQLQIDYQDPKLRTLSSPGAAGLLPVREALDKLLAGTGAAYTFTGGNRVSIGLRSASASINVSDKAAAPTSPKYSEPLRNLPQTISIIPRKIMEEQGATNLGEVLRNVPGLTIAAGEGGAPAGDNLTLRGFSARNDIFVDGVRDLGPQSRDPFNMEQVEVIKGPQSAYTGRGSTGGSINLVSKAPNLNRYFGGSVNLGSASMRRFTGDANIPMGRRTAFRMNALFHEAGTPGRDAVESERRGLAPALMFGLGSPTRLTLSYYRLRQTNLPDYGIPWVTATHNLLAAYRDQPAPVPRETYYGLRSRDRETTGSDLGTVRLEHDFSDNFQLRNQLRYGHSTRDSITTAPRFASNDSYVINRNGPSWLTRDSIWDNQTDFRASFQTGAIGHTAVMGAALSNENNIRKSRTVTGTPTTDLFRPDPNQPFNGAVVESPIVADSTANTRAIYAFDTVKLGDHLQVNGGLRWERFAAEGINTAGAPLNRVDSMRSVRAGIVYKPTFNGSIYASYGTSLNPSLEGLNYQPAGTTLEPEKTYTTEGGVKWDLLSNRLSLSGAIFRVEKSNARTPGVLPDDPPQVLQGRQRVAGVELGASGFITRRWQLYGAYTYLGNQVVRSNTPAEIGKQLINTPPHSFSLWSTYRFRKLTFGGGPRFVDKRYANTTNTRSAPRYWTVDAMASYPVSQHIDLRLNVFNAGDTFYFERLGGGHLIPGAARAANVSCNFRF